MIVAACKKCGSTEKTSRGDECKHCANARSAAWRAANPDKAKKFVADWVSKNKEQKAKIDAKWGKENAEKKRASYARWKDKHPGKQESANAEWYLNNKEQRKANNKAWQLKNYGLLLRYSQNRRANKKNVGGVLSRGLKEKLFSLQRGKCACCSKPLGKYFHMDHIMPLALGGSNTDDNMQLLTATCNLQKNAKHPVKFMQQRGFLL